MDTDISDEDLHAFIDGELDPIRAGVVAAGLDASPALSERARRFQADKDQLARIYGPLIDRPLPAALLSRALAPAPRTLPWALAAAAVLVAAVLLGYPALTRDPADALVADALAARAGNIQPREAFAGDTVAGTAKPTRIVRAALGVPVNAPDLGRAGFGLSGIKIYRSGAKASVELSYRDRKGRLFTVYLHGPTGGDQFALREQGAARICIWRNEDLSAVMVGEMSSSEMLRVASLTYGDLNF